MGSGAESGDQFQLLLIGAGRMGLTHLRALNDSRTVAVCAVVDPSAAARGAAAEIDPAVPAYATLDEALAAESADGVLIAAPSTLHRRLVEACAERRLPILCEKPCGTNIDDIDAAGHAADEAGVPLQIGYWRRYVPGLQALRRRYEDGEFGELLMISSWQWDGQPPDASFQASSGGIVIDMAVHEFDLIRWLTGQELPAPAPASIVPAANEANTDPDSASLLLELSGGAVALISLGRYFPHGDCVWVELMGTRGHARVDVLWGDPGEQVFHDALRAQAQDFARRVRAGGTGVGLGASAADARRTLELAQRATEARSPRG
jgi:myo-inositol 2-dehydrogenase/D-chiro-inositol 1-dehydrogenase